MSEVEVIPKGTWRNAIHCSVKDMVRNITHDEVLIVRKFPQSDTETFTIEWQKLPMVILNEMNPGDPDDSRPINDDLQHLETIRVAPAQNPIDVDIMRNAGWPDGKVLMPE